MKEREIIGEGYEHKVVKGGTPDRQVVFKTPKPLTQFGVILNGGVQSLRQEHADTMQALAHSGVLVPETRIIPFGRSYVVVQEYVAEDATVSIPAFLQEHAPDRVKQQYLANPANFIASQQRVYRVDTTVGRMSRLLMASRILNRTQVDSIKDTVRKVIRRVG